MSVGLVAFLFGMTAFLVVYALKAPFATLPDDMAAPMEIPMGPRNPDSIFEKYVRPMVRNLLPQTPLAAQMKARNNHRVAELLVRSGNPWNIQPEEYFGVQVLSTVGGFFVFMLLTAIEALPDVMPNPAWVILGTLLGFYFPKVRLDRAKGARLKSARKGLPEALDLLVITLNAGMNFAPALVEVVHRLPGGVMREELRRVSADLRAGKPLERAMLDLARRAPSDEVEAFSKAVVVSEKLGSDVSETLRSQSESARQAYEASLDVKIGKLSTTLFFPILIMMLPALFFVILAPAFSNIGKAF